MMEINPSGEELIYEAIINNKGAIWKLTISTNTHIWVRFTFRNIDSGLSIFSLNRFVVGGGENVSRSLNILFEWGNPTPVWSLENRWGEGLWYMLTSEVVQVGSRFYFSWVLTNLNYIVFCGNSISDGSVQTTRWVFNNYLSRIRNSFLII